MSSDLSRFETAQALVYPQAWRELQNGKKKSHWMWYIFPQIQGLGQSAMSVKYAINDLSEAHAYLNHPILGLRLIECCTLLLHFDDKTAVEIFGEIDALKLHSSLTLFSLVQDNQPIFDQLLRQFFAGKLDDKTVQLVQDNA
ncbi:DUF1810 domain-containing protein [Moraxella sp. ZJ142]|uniref:DUF1810 domain-containing protein n=1 Tax=Moraxella marmotae TaxID=3344520 RepID=UPI0035D435D7